MIRGVKIIRQFGRNNRITEFSYKNYKGGCLTEEFEAMTKDDFELLNNRLLMIKNIGRKSINASPPNVSP